MSRAIALGALLVAAGCYDVDALSRHATSNVSDMGGGGGAGGGWRAVTVPTSVALRGVFGSDGGDVIAVGASSTILHVGGAIPTLDAAPPGFALRAVWTGGGTAYAVGDTGAVLSPGTGGWPGASMVDATFYAITASAMAEPLVAGSGGTIMERSAGGTWSGIDSGVGAQLRGAWLRAGGDTLVVGDGGTILRGSAAGWTSENGGVTADLEAVWANATDSWIVGAGGVVLHAGADDAWALEASGTTADLLGVFGAGDVVWAVGAGGTIVARHAGVWSIERSGGPDLHAVWASASGAWAVGDAGVVLTR